MRKFYSFIVRNPKKIIVFFLILAVCGAVLRNFVEVNYNMKDFLPADSPSTVSLQVMESEFDGGINEYTDGVAQIVAGYNGIISGANELMTGSKNLAAGAATMSDSTAELVNGIAELNDGAGELKSGTSEMKEQTNGMDSEISDKIDEMISGITGGGISVQSFVSEKNTNVKSVQFVISTEAVKIDDTPAAAAVKEEKLNFWQKILRLFGLY